MKNLRIIILLIVPFFCGACQEEETGGGEPAPFTIYYMYVNEENGGPYQFESEEWVKENIECFIISPGSIRHDYDSLYFYKGAYIFERSVISPREGLLFFKHPNNDIDTIQYHWEPLYEDAPDWNLRKLTHTFKGEVISELDFKNDDELKYQTALGVIDPDESRILIRIPYTH